MSDDSPASPGSRRPWLRYAGAVVLVVVLALLIWFLTRPDDEPAQTPAAAPSTSAAPATSSPAATTEIPLPAGTPDVDRPAQGRPTLVEDLAVGECLWSSVPLTDPKLGYTVNTVPCSDRHSAEVYGLYQVPDQPYFGQEGQITQGSPGSVDLSCPDPAALQARHPDDSLRLALFYPTERSWNGGARTAACVVSIQTSSGSTEYPGHL